MIVIVVVMVSDEDTKGDESYEWWVLEVVNGSDDDSLVDLLWGWECKEEWNFIMTSSCRCELRHLASRSTVKIVLNLRIINNRNKIIKIKVPHSTCLFTFSVLFVLFFRWTSTFYHHLFVYIFIYLFIQFFIYLFTHLVLNSVCCLRYTRFFLSLINNPR